MKKIYYAHPNLDYSNYDALDMTIEDVFGSVLEFGDMSTLKWLISTFHINIKDINDELYENALMVAAEDGNLQLANWIVANDLVSSEYIDNMLSFTGEDVGGVIEWLKTLR